MREAITKLSRRELNQDTSKAKRAAKRGPVFITNRGRPSEVLLTAEEYQRITAGQKSIATYWQCHKLLIFSLKRLA
jgi:prevent-host-death family protein